ncbi:hypothetical protein RJ639_037044 [Escallonia herrerae]|uniref:DCD domain-containing protein n=1 Tax=Escallonia herrerae TaxID=1293975 RepID=A0AA89BDG7_9ASTE|nr:hypothetical protein RJ639_037044 [Escallonia herrerae]
MRIIYAFFLCPFLIPTTHERTLTGLPYQHFSYVKNIDPGLPLFLFNYSDRTLHGIFEAASPGQMNINPYGWTSDGSAKTQYPAQVQIRVRMQCEGLKESQFKPIITDNYYSHRHFWFELDHAQTNRLLSLLSSAAIAPSSSAPQNSAKWRYLFRSLPSSDKSEEGEGFDALDVEYGTSSKSNHNQLMEACSSEQVVEEDEKDLIYKKLKELVLSHDRSDSTLTGCGEDTAVVNDLNLEDRSFPGDQTILEEKNDEIPINSSNYPSVIAKLVQEMEELKAFKVEHIYKMGCLEQKLVQAETEIRQLKDQCLLSVSVSNPSVPRVDETLVESLSEVQLDLDDSIFLVGGYDGVSHLSTFKSYSPSQDVIKSLKPMNSVRSYTSVAELNGELYIFGGGNGISWYDTVEAYDISNQQWSLRPSLSKEKGSLAGGSVNGKIFALGGGNSSESFSDVEMFDLDVGRWILARSMQEKRFALASAELNGALYAVGGYDGSDYLKSAERFDPREHSWTKIESMNSKRGCHSLVALNEKLYALGGYDGTAMVQSIEIFDPRRGSWMSGEPMNQSRGYSATALWKESIYMIGGVEVNTDIIDTLKQDSFYGFLLCPFFILTTHERNLTGLSYPHFSYVRNIAPGLPLFLFNYSYRTLHGIFEATSSGRLKIDPYAWSSDGSAKTQYPAQVQIRVRMQCEGVKESKFKPIIKDNYYDDCHFWFELDHDQTNKLISLLSSAAINPSSSAPKNSAKWKNIFRSLPSPDKSEKIEGFDALDIENKTASKSKNNRSMEACSSEQVVEKDEKDLIYKRLKELVLSRDCSDSTLTGCAEDTAVVNDLDLEDGSLPGGQTISEEEIDEISTNSSNYPSVIAMLIQEMEELKASKIEHNYRIAYLEQKLVQAETKIRWLKDRCMISEFVSNPSVPCVDEMLIESLSEVELDLDDSMFLVGGYDGVSHLSTFKSYSPIQDVITSLKPMNSVRSYTSVAELNGELYIFGGGNENSWYDTVEAYDPSNNRWSSRPSLSKKKGNLAGGSVNGKIFALGGGNGIESFSDVEMFDLDVGRWILGHSMQEKRFALASAELNGALYAVGGHDGSDYLKSAERFDPREHSWAKIGSMNSKRGCHSLVAMHEKLYALGGYDGNAMVQSVEIFDPRRGSWMSGEPMNQSRGYSATALLKESIYMIGGVKTNNDIIDTIERYQEGQGWQLIHPRNMGKLCFSSAIVLQSVDLNL